LKTPLFRFVLALVTTLLTLSCRVQAQTSTTCTSTENLGTVKTDCTSKPEQSTSAAASVTKAIDQHRSVDWDKINAGNIARAEARQAQKQEVIDIVYCRQNPNSSLKPAGKPDVSCTDVLAYAQAKCTAEPKSKTCKSLAAIDKRNKPQS
jgi:hypothetical protein